MLFVGLKYLKAQPAAQDLAVGGLRQMAKVLEWRIR
jgi:hypothetical protein